MQKLYSKKTHVERKKKRELKKNRTRTEEAEHHPTERFEDVPEQPTRSLIWVGKTIKNLWNGRKIEEHRNG